jgi:hypothetical protein
LTADSALRDGKVRPLSPSRILATVRAERSNRKEGKKHFHLRFFCSARHDGRTKSVRRNWRLAGPFLFKKLDEMAYTKGEEGAKKGQVRLGRKEINESKNSEKSKRASPAAKSQKTSGESDTPSSASGKLETNFSFAYKIAFS